MAEIRFEHVLAILLECSAWDALRAFTSFMEDNQSDAQDVDGLYEAGCTDFADVFVYVSTQ